MNVALTVSDNRCQVTASSAPREVLPRWWAVLPGWWAVLPGWWVVWPRALLDLEFQLDTTWQGRHHKVMWTRYSAEREYTTHEN